MKANKIFAKAINKAASLALLLATSLGLTAFAGTGPDLNGVWKLNQDESDNIKEKIEQTIGKKKGLFGGMKQKRMREALENVKAPETLQITQRGSQITITRPDGRARIIYTDGRNQQIETRNGKAVEMNATQRPEQIVIETRTEDGRGKIIETYALRANGRKLNVTLQIEGERLGKPLVIRRIYDAAGKDFRKGAIHGKNENI